MSGKERELGNYALGNVYLLEGKLCLRRKKEIRNIQNLTDQRKVCIFPVLVISIKWLALNKPECILGNKISSWLYVQLLLSKWGLIYILSFILIQQWKSYRCLLTKLYYIYIVFEYLKWDILSICIFIHRQMEHFIFIYSNIETRLKQNGLWTVCFYMHMYSDHPLTVNVTIIMLSASHTL